MTGVRPPGSSFVPDSCTLPAGSETGWDKRLRHVRLWHIGRWARRACEPGSASGREGTKLRGGYIDGRSMVGWTRILPS
jgi:hypothetical protein